ncbi:accessory Sec system protein Asp2 [Mammaliicoccus sciuri]|uniref:accessory Sec system protein Asp2 n=1 Tax=Mammaliicoccus sciuri TaxID=1296 RepID=UPI002DBB9D97|nr:accessory Sec system protein Asp2 [Mammaliicoccus sciuri]
MIPNRMFPKFFDGIERSLVKNVYTLRIMDLNVSHGSHYLSTTNYPEYEEEIQSTILKVMEELNIDKEHVVLYGGSKGGAGAIYHGTALDMNTLAVDPIVNIGGALE